MSDDPEIIDPAIEARAREWLHRKQTGDIDRSQWPDGFQNHLTPESTKAGAEILGPLGEPVELKFVGSDTNALDITTYRFHVTFPNARVLYVFGLRPDGKINQFSIKPIPGEVNPFEHLFPTP